MRFHVFSDNGFPALAVTEGGKSRRVAPTGNWRETIASLHGKSPAPGAEVNGIPAALPAALDSKILCVGLNYRDHAKEGGMDLPDHPNFFTRYLSSFVADGAALQRPRNSAKFDYEAELAIVIGRTARHIAVADALDHVFGYTLGMDGSVRDFQRRTSQFTLGKNFDRSGALGAVIVTPDELAPGAGGLSIRSVLNGELMQDGNTADLVFGTADLVAAASACMTLEPGDLILTGTPAGVGFARKPPVYLKAGDRLEVSIEGIGTLVNSVIDET